MVFLSLKLRNLYLLEFLFFFPTKFIMINFAYYIQLGKHKMLAQELPEGF